MELGDGQRVRGYTRREGETGPAAQGVWLPRWAHYGNGPAQSEFAVAAWRSFVLAHPSASIYFMPEIALLRGQNGAQPIVHAQWREGVELVALAILPARRLQLAIAPGIRTGLVGRRVLENTVLCDGSAQAVERFASGCCLLLAPPTDCLVMPDVDIDSPLRPAMARMASESGLLCCQLARPAPHWWIRFPEEPGSYWSQFTKKSRYNFRYRAKHLEHAVRCVQAPEEVADYTAQVDELIRRTWQHKRLGMAIELRQKLELWQEIARLGAFRSYLLQQGGRTIAFATGVQWKGQFSYEETGYDPEFAAKSPGQVLLYRIIEDLIARDTPRQLDFGYGDNEYKRIFANHQTLSGPIVVVRHALAPYAKVRLSQLRAATGRGLRAALAKAGVISAVRHLYRGHRKPGKDQERGPAESTPAASQMA